MATRRQSRECALQMLYACDNCSMDEQAIFMCFDEILPVEIPYRTFAVELYRGVCSHREEIDRLIEKYPKNATEKAKELCQYYADKYARKLAEVINRDNEITARVPSVMIAGASNFPVRKKEKQIAALSKLYQENGDLFTPEDCYYMKKIRTILTNNVIYSDDACVLEKLNDKLADLQAAHKEKIKRN